MRLSIFLTLSTFAFATSLSAVLATVTFNDTGLQTQIETDGIASWFDLRARLEKSPGEYQNWRIRYKNLIRNPCDPISLVDGDEEPQISIEKPMFIKLLIHHPKNPPAEKQLAIENQLNSWGDFHALYIGGDFSGDKLIYAGKIKNQDDPWDLTRHQCGAGVTLRRSGGQEILPLKVPSSPKIICDNKAALPKSSELFAQAEFYSKLATIKLAIEENRWEEAAPLLNEITQEHEGNKLVQDFLSEVNGHLGNQINILD